jgi:glutathione synthase
LHGADFSRTTKSVKRAEEVERGVRFVVVMDPVETVREPSDTTYALMKAAVERGHEVRHCGPADVRLESGRAIACTRAVSLAPGRQPPIVLGAPATAALADVDAVLVRLDPPFDARYLALTLVLDHAGTVVLNRPQGLRDANEKLYGCRFPELMPATVVTADPVHIRAFVDAHPHGAVLKPLDGHAGLGIVKLTAGDVNTASLVEDKTARGTRLVMVQEYLEAVREGDKRILLCDGAPVGALLRVPRPDDFRSNLRAGAHGSLVELDATDARIVRAIAPHLRADGLWIAGIDVIGGRLTEVNVTSPTGLQHLVTLSGARPDLDVLQRLEETIARHRSS